MTLNEDETLYDVLEVTADKSSEEIRKAYFRIKAAYEKENVVLYSLISSEDREATLKKVESAYLILSDPEKRKQYDQYHGILKVEEKAPEILSVTPPQEPEHVEVSSQSTTTSIAP